jgi:hypothetical protein
MSTLMDQARNRVPRFAEAAVERARLTVVPRPMGRSRRAARVPFVTLVSLLLVGGVAGLLFFNTSMQQVSFTATSLEQQAQVLDAQRQSLQMRLDTLRDPQRVALQAKRMGMVPPASPAFIRLGTGRVLGDALPASSQDSFRVTPLPTKKPKHLAPRPVIIEKAPRTKAATGGAALADGRAASGTKKAHPSDTETQGSQR